MSSSKETALLQAVQELTEFAAREMSRKGHASYHEPTVRLFKALVQPIVLHALVQGRAQAPAPERRHYRQAFTPMTACGLKQRGFCVTEWSSVDCMDCLGVAPPSTAAPTGDRREP